MKKQLNEYPVRQCKHMHECCICKQKITGGQYYYDGGYDNRAHINCVRAKK